MLEQELQQHECRAAKKTWKGMRGTEYGRVEKQHWLAPPAKLKTPWRIDYFQLLPRENWGSRMLDGKSSRAVSERGQLNLTKFFLKISLTWLNKYCLAAEITQS